jgi:hypothetical protein
LEQLHRIHQLEILPEQLPDWVLQRVTLLAVTLPERLERDLDSEALRWQLHLLLHDCYHHLAMMRNAIVMQCLERHHLHHVSSLPRRLRRH